MKKWNMSKVEIDNFKANKYIAACSGYSRDCLGKAFLDEIITFKKRLLSSFRKFFCWTCWIFRM